MISLTSLAQSTDNQVDPIEQRANRATQRMAKELGLSEEQEAQVLAINIEFAKARQEEMGSANGVKEDIRKSREKIREQMQEKDMRLLEVLTEEQATKWEEIKKERQAQRKRRARGIQ